MHESSLSLLFCTTKGTKEHKREECFSCLRCVCGEENDCEKVFRYLVLETLSYQDWELEVLLGSGRIGEHCWLVSVRVLSDLIHGVQWSISPFVFTKSSIPCQSSLASPSNPQMKQVSMRSKKDLEREKNQKRNVMKENGRERESLRKIMVPWGRAQQRKWVRKRKKEMEGKLEKDNGTTRKSANKKWVRGRHNLNYCLNFEFHPTIGWNYFFYNYE